MSSVGDAMTQYLEVSGLGAKLGDWRVFEAWKAVVGEMLSRRARAVSFQRGVLTVEVESAAHLQELKSFTGERYRVLTKEHLGKDKIRRMSFKLKR